MSGTQEIRKRLTEALKLGTRAAGRAFTGAQ